MMAASIFGTGMTTQEWPGPETCTPEQREAHAHHNFVQYIVLAFF